MEKNKEIEINSKENKLETDIENKKTDKNAIIKLANLFLIIAFINLFIIGFQFFSTLTLIAYYLILVCIVIITLFAFIKTIKPWFDKGEEINQFLKSIYFIIPYALAIGLASSLIALTIYITQKTYVNRTSKIITSSIVVGLFVVLNILKFII